MTRMDDGSGKKGSGEPFAPAVEVMRSGQVESVHYAALALVDARGELEAFLGDPHQGVVLRSSMKFMQALPFFEEGFHERLGLTREEQAITMGSHSGQSAHVEAVLSILKKAGVEPGALKCGRHRPFHGPTSRELGGDYNDIHNGCSAKHAMMLATCRLMGWDEDTYLEFGHPLQVRIREVIARIAGLPVDRVVPVVDGCNAPTHVIPLASLARCFAVLGGCYSAVNRKEPDPDGDGELPQGLRHLPPEWVPLLGEMARLHVEHPFMIAGDDRFDTDMMLAGNMDRPSLICKVGGEAVHATAVLPDGMELAVKISDGEFRPLGPVIVEALEQLGILRLSAAGGGDGDADCEGGEERGATGGSGEDRAAAFRRLKHPVVRTHSKQEVGELRPRFRMHQRVHRTFLTELGYELPF